MAHHVATSHLLRERRRRAKFVNLEEMESLPAALEFRPPAEHRDNLDRLAALIQRLRPIDRQVIVSYLEDMDAASIGEITGLSPANVAMRFREGESHGR